MSVREVRAIPADGVEVRTSADGSPMHFRGHAAVFNERTWIGPPDPRIGFYEQVDPGFFRNVLNDDAAFLINHDPNILLARNGNTMSLSIDERGLVVDADFDSTDPEAVMWAGRMARGDLTQMSFAFTVAKDGHRFEVNDDGTETRTLLTAERLYDASGVTYPAYAGTDGGMRQGIEEVIRRHRGEFVDPRDDDIPGRLSHIQIVRHRMNARRLRLPL